MPQVIKLADGTEKEIPTEEELQALKSEAEKAKEFSEFFDSENKQINWSLVRKKIKQNEKSAENSSSTSAPVSAPVEKPISTEEIIEKASEAARIAAEKVAQENYLANLMSSYGNEEKQVIKTYFDKLTAGEKLSFDSIFDFFKKSVDIAYPDKTRTRQTARVVSGSVPRLDFDQATGKRIEKPFSETEEGAEVANFLFGDASFAKKQP